MLMEPWDGPASLTFTDGRILGATLDRNGLRPGRWVVTDDGWFALASEAGRVRRAGRAGQSASGRLLPGRLVVVDPGRGGCSPTARPRWRWRAQALRGRGTREHALHLDDLPARARRPRPERRRCANASWRSAGRQEDLRVLLAPMAADAKEPTGSMGNDAALAVLSDRQPPLFSLLQAAVRPGDEPGRSTRCARQVVMSLSPGWGRRATSSRRPPSRRAGW